jgi:hypothetical protein
MQVVSCVTCGKKACFACSSQSAQTIACRACNEQSDHDGDGDLLVNVCHASGLWRLPTLELLLYILMHGAGMD